MVKKFPTTGPLFESVQRLWDSLTDTPATATELGEASKVTRADVVKYLDGWAEAGALVKVTEGKQATYALPARSRRVSSDPLFNSDGSPRLTGGSLAAMVLDHLKAHPKEDFTGSAIGKALNRSSGAVSNALETMVQRGQAVQTSEAPRKFRFAGRNGKAAPVKAAPPAKAPAPVKAPAPAKAPAVKAAEALATIKERGRAKAPAAKATTTKATPAPTVTEAPKAPNGNGGTKASVTNGNSTTTAKA